MFVKRFSRIVNKIPLSHARELGATVGASRNAGTCVIPICYLKVYSIITVCERLNNMNTKITYAAWFLEPQAGWLAASSSASLLKLQTEIYITAYVAITRIT